MYCMENTGLKVQNERGGTIWKQIGPRPFIIPRKNADNGRSIELQGDNRMQEMKRTIITRTATAYPAASHEKKKGWMYENIVHDRTKKERVHVSQIIIRISDLLGCNSTSVLKKWRKNTSWN